MAQSELTVTPPNPTPPTNMTAAGATGPNPPNYTKLSYADWYDNTKFDTAAPAFPATAPALTPVAFAANAAAIAGGSGATAGGTENTYPGTDTPPIDTVNAIGAVPASTSAAHEGGTVTVVKPPGNIDYTYPILPSGTVTLSTTQMVSLASPTYTVNPNADHPSAKAPSVLPTITALTPSAPVSGQGQLASLTVTGTGYRPDSVVTLDGYAQPTTYVNATSLKVMNPTKKLTAGNIAVKVSTGGTATAATNWAFS